MSVRTIALALLLALAPVGSAFAQADEVAHPDPRVEQRLKELGEGLRCMVCQNQTIADSNAPLALDLRNQIRAQVAAGRSDDQIRAYMVARYGDFVLYRPPFKANTILLWAGPFVLLAFGFGVLWKIVLRQRARPERGPSGGERRAEIAALLEADGETGRPAKPAR